MIHMKLVDMFLTFTFAQKYYLHFRIKQIKKDVNKLLQTHKEKMQRKTATKKEQEKTRTKKLGYLKYPFNFDLFVLK